MRNDPHNRSMHGRKIGLSLFLVALIALALIPQSRSLLFERHLFAAVDETATAYVDQGLVRAGSAFAIARTFNAVVSVVQESQLQLEPGGVGVSLALGAALDPVNDLVERFSWVMLVSLTSLGIQKVLIEITPFISVQIVLVLALFAMLAGLWLPRSVPYDISRIGRKLVVVAILLRFAVPAMAYLNNQVYVIFLNDRYDQSVETLGSTVDSLEQYQFDEMSEEPPLAPALNADERSWWERTREALEERFDKGAKALDIRARVEAIKKAALNLIDRIVDLIVVFVLNTIILPLLFFWGGLKLARLLIVRSFGEGLIPPRPGDDV